MRNTTLILLACLGLVLAACPPADDTTTPEGAEQPVAEDGAEAEEGGCPHADKHHAHGEGHHGEGHHGDGHPSPFHAEGIDSGIENLDNGVKMSFTSEDAETVAHIQEHMAKKAESGEGCGGDCPCGWDGVTKSVENLANGLAVTLTHEDAETVTKMQEAIAAKAAEESEGGCCGGGESAHPGAILHSDSVTRAVENLDNGVKVSFTAGCPHLQGEIKTATAAMVAAKASGEKSCDCAMHAEGVTVASEEIEGGMALVFTTENTELVTELQESAAKKAAGEACGCGKHGAEGDHAGHDHGDKAEGDCGCGKHGEQADAPAEQPDAA
jgi:hypothetical protein